MCANNITEDIARLEIRKELARRDFFYYCNAKSEDFYKEDRKYLVELCNQFQDFYKSDDDILIINLPPRHGKSRTAQLFAEWVFGQNTNEKIMTASYNENLSTTFSKSVRNSIMEEKADANRIVYSDIFPYTRIKRGDGAMSLWGLEGGYNNYLATSPTGTATGFGASCFIANTSVATDKGYKNIQDIKVGDLVLSCNHEAKCYEFKKVEALYNNEVNSIVEVKTTNRVIKCTSNHEFYVKGRGYIEASNLKQGFLLDTIDLYDDEVVSVSPIHEKNVVYDIQVKDNHNYFANGVLVHNCIIVDDLIKNAEEARNDTVLEKHWDWFTNTMLSRLEEGGKIIIIMTRWAEKDLAGRAIKYFTEEGKNIRTVKMKALQDDGTMLCDDVLSKASYTMKVRAMGEDIAAANYQQEPIDVKGKLYSSFKTYEELPPYFEAIRCCTDTADEGSDYLASLVYGVYNKEAYILDALFTKEPMEITEGKLADMLHRNKVNLAKIESNNGGKGFARNVKRILLEKHDTNKTIIKWYHQNKNKKARILSNSTWVMDHIYFPSNWKSRWTEMYNDLTSYQKEGKNKNDDIEDCVTSVAEEMQNKGSVSVLK